MIFIVVNFELQKFSYCFVGCEDSYYENISFNTFRETDTHYLFYSTSNNGTTYSFPKNASVLEKTQLNYKSINS